MNFPYAIITFNYPAYTQNNNKKTFCIDGLLKCIWKNKELFLCTPYSMICVLWQEFVSYTECILELSIGRQSVD